jgi:type II secretory pathway component GspD/PulD (secretin)
VLRALAEGNLATQISNPTLITEDNEQAIISIIDRIPIITSTSTAATGAANPTVTEEVRYKIDSSDISIDTNPDKHREIGISMVVTPTLLPDGTVRMKLRPRSAQIVEYIKSASGNQYPRVAESMIETLARVPDGFSLIVGGFYGEAKSKGGTKVPILGDIPLLNFFFKSKEALKEQSSLVFVVTPRSYEPTSTHANNSATSRLRAASTLSCDHDWVDADNPGPAHEPNLKRTLRGMEPSQAPYYPRTDELAPQETPQNAAPAARSTPRFSRAGKH